MHNHGFLVASYPAFMNGGRTPGFSRLHMHEFFPEIRETMLFWYSFTYGLRMTVLFWNSSAYDHLQRQWRRVLINLGLTHNLCRWRIQWPKAMEKWPCGDCFTFSSVILHDAVLIENNQYGCVSLRNNGTLKIGAWVWTIVTGDTSEATWVSASDLT